MYQLRQKKLSWGCRVGADVREEKASGKTAFVCPESKTRKKPAPCAKNLPQRSEVHTSTSMGIRGGKGGARVRRERKKLKRKYQKKQNCRGKERREFNG